MIREGRQPYVEWKRRFSDDWTRAWFTHCNHYDRALMPTLGTAELEYDYGSICRPGLAGFIAYAPFWSGRGLYWVRVRGADLVSGLMTTWWIGCVEGVSDRPGGADTASGREVVTAYSAESLLTRTAVDGSWIESGGTSVKIDTLLTFNRRGHHGNQILGNRSARTIGGSYVFSDADDAAVWSAADAVNYILDRFEMPGAIGGDGFTNLRADRRVVRQRPTVAETLAQLIDRRRGTCWFLEETGGGGLTTVVRSTLEAPIGPLAANADRFAIDLDADERIADVVRTENASARYSRVEVRGGPIVHCGTFCFGDGSLDMGWDLLAVQAWLAAVRAGNKQAATDSRFADVLRRFIVPRYWSRQLSAHRRELFDPLGVWLEASVPASYRCRDDGRPLGDSVPFFRAGAHFLRQLPLREGYDYTGSQPRQVGATVAEGGEFAKPAVYVTAKIASEDVWAPIDQASVIKGQTLPSPGCHVTLLDNELGIHLGSRYPHYLAKFEDDPITGLPAGQPAIFDWRRIVATMAYTNDRILQVGLDIPGVLPASPPRVLTLRVPDAEYWRLLPMTVVGVQEGKLTYCETGMVLRDDSDRLRSIADLARSWYGRTRSALTVHYGVVEAGLSPAAADQNNRFQIGGLITTATWHGAPHDIGAVVSRVRVDCQRQTTTIQTDFAEVDLAAAAGWGGGDSE